MAAAQPLETLHSPQLSAAFDAWITQATGVDAKRFDALLLQHGAVVAGSFCLPAIAQVYGPPLHLRPSDVDVWVPREQAAAFTAALVALLRRKVWWPWFQIRNPAVSVKERNFGLSQYSRLREDVESIAWVDNRGDSRGAGLLSFQVMACRSLPRALASFDLNVCAVAWTGAALQVWGANALQGIQHRTMTLNAAALERQSASELKRTLLRVRKYIAYGFGLESTAPLVAALHEHFGVACAEGSSLCENYVTYFMNTHTPMPPAEQANLRAQAQRERERVDLVKTLLRLVSKNCRPLRHLAWGYA